MKNFLKNLFGSRAQMRFNHNVTFTRYDKDGNVTAVVKSKNRTCKEGRTNVMARLGDFNTTGTSKKGVITSMAIGTSNTAPTDNDTTLGAEQMRSSIVAAQTIFDEDTITVHASFGAGQAFTIQEAGLFTDETEEMLAHTLPDSPLAKGADDVIVLQWELSLADA